MYIFWQELMGRIIPEDQKDGVRQRLLVFLEEPDFAVCPSFLICLIRVGRTNGRLPDLNSHCSCP
jgi:hypothetical protein